MGIFSSPSPFDQDVEKVTDEKNMGEDWGAILDICDKVKAITTGPKDCLRAILRRLNHQNPHVAIQAVTLLDACVNNCGKPFHLEVASRDCDAELRRLLGRSHPKVAENLRVCIKKWAEGEFKKDSQLGLIPSLYQQLREKGMDFGVPAESSTARNSSAAKSSGASTSQEEEDLAKAIELSLKESAKPKTATTSLYSGLLDSSYTTTTPAVVQPVKEARKVRALYDFEAAEDNELTFKAGEILHVLDDSDANWWRGSNQRGEGLFPANFVTSDLSTSVGPEGVDQSDDSKKTKTNKVQFKEEVEVKHVEEEVVDIDEAKMDRLLYLLQEADPTGERPDAEELISLEEQVASMGPLIDAELDKVDRKHATLTRLSADLVEALNLYHSLMKEQPTGPISGQVSQHGPQPSVPPQVGHATPHGPMYPPPHPYGYPPGPLKPVLHGAAMPTYPPPGQVPAYPFPYPGPYGAPMTGTDGQHQQGPIHAPSHPQHLALQHAPPMMYGLERPFQPHPPPNM